MFACYRIIAKGAGGGLGSRGLGSSRGALAISVFELRKDEDIHILVGQKGENACTRTHCNRGNSDNETTPSDLLKSSDDINSKTKQVKELVFEEMAGGGKSIYFSCSRILSIFLMVILFLSHSLLGGGATFIYLINSANGMICSNLALRQRLDNTLLKFPLFFLIFGAF